jgi:multimeric flavodoxin WrbA
MGDNKILLVIAIPMYEFSISAQTKLFINRCYALEGPQEEYGAFAGKRIGIVLTYADVDPFISAALNALRILQNALNYVGAVIVGMVFGCPSQAGEIKNNRDPMEEAYANWGKALLWHRESS